MRFNYLAAALGLLLLTAPAVSRADVLDEIGGGSSSSTRSFQRQQRSFTAGDEWIKGSAVEQVNWTGFLERLYTLLTSDEYLGAKYPEVKQAAELAKSMGDFNLAGTMEKCSINGEDMKLQFGSYYRDLDPASLRGRTFGLKDAELVSAEYVGEGDHLLYFAMNHLPERIQLTVDAMNQAQQAGGGEDTLGLDQLLNEMGAGDIGMLLGLASSMGVDQMAADMISGEVALVLYDLPPFDKLDSGDIQPSDIGAALMVGLKDAAKLEAMIAGFGANAGLVALETSGESWKGYSLPGAEGVTLIYNHEIAAVVTNASVLERIQMAQQSGGSDLGACQYFLDVDIANLEQRAIAPLFEMCVAELGQEMEEGKTIFVPSKETAFLLELPESSALGHLTASGHHDQAMWPR